MSSTLLHSYKAKTNFMSHYLINRIHENQHLLACKKRKKNINSVNKKKQTSVISATEAQVVSLKKEVIMKNVNLPLQSLVAPLKIQRSRCSHFYGFH